MSISPSLTYKVIILEKAAKVKGPNLECFVCCSLAAGNIFWEVVGCLLFVTIEMSYVLSSGLSLSHRNHVLLAKTAKAEGPNPDRFGLLLVGCSIFSWTNLSFSMWVEAEARKFFKPNLEAAGAVDTIGTFLRSTWKNSLENKCHFFLTDFCRLTKDTLNTWGKGEQGGKLSPKGALS